MAVVASCRPLNQPTDPLVPKSPKTPDPEALRLKMASLCARAEQCSSDILKKLRRAGLSSSESQEIIDYLKQHRFISDQRFAEVFARDKVRFAGWGRYKIRQALRAKAIPDGLIQSALASVDEADYVEALEKAMLAKARSLDLTDRNDAVKLFRHLASRGFESSLTVPRIKKLIKQARELS